MLVIVGWKRESSIDMVGRLGVQMVSVATVAEEEVDNSSYIGAIAARLRWGRCARSCRYSRYYSNNVGLPSDSDDLTCGER